MKEVFRIFSIAFILSLRFSVEGVTQNPYAVLFSATPESYPGGKDGKLVVTVANQNLYTAPYTFKINEINGDPIEIINNDGTATFINLGYRYYCVTVIMGNGCFTYGCFQFDEACSSEDCLIADFDFAYTSDGCALQYYDWSQGDATSWDWDFGDGTNSTDQNPLHTYSESKCYNVTLRATNGSLTREISKEVCITACTDDNSPAPECQINAPTFAAAGQTINLSVAGIGVAPFEYVWTTNGLLAPGSNGSGPTISALIPSSANNGDQYNFSTHLTDNNNYSTDCYYTVTVGGNPPDVEVAAFGSFEALKPLVLVAFVDVFNLTGLEEYFFELTPYGSQVINPEGTCLNTWLNGDWDCTLFDNVVPEGFYQLCVTVRDDAGSYKDCMDITIGNPGPLPPPPPPMILEVKSPTNPKIDQTTGHFIVSEGDPIYVGIAGSHPHELGCNEYKIIWHFENLTLQLTSTQGSIYAVPNNQDRCGCTDCSDTYPGGLSWGGKAVSVDCNDPVFSTGTIKITAEIYSQCNEEFVCVDEFLTPVPLFLDLHPGKPVISDVAINNSSCDFPITISISSDCHIASYEWHAYDPNSNEEIEGFFTGNTNAAMVYPDLNHEMYLQYQSGAVVRFRCKVIVVDVNGFTAEFSSLIMMRVPLRIDLPATIYRCPGAESHFSETSIAAGGISGYEYEWSVVQPVGSGLDFASNDPNDPNPLFTAPTGGSKQYHLRVKNVNEYGELVCQVEKDITVSISNLSLNLPDFTWPVCSPGGREVGPVNLNLGGSGHYTYDWSPTTYLSDPAVSNPLILGIPLGETINYSLTVTDIYGGVHQMIILKSQVLLTAILFHSVDQQAFATEAK